MQFFEKENNKVCNHSLLVAVLFIYILHKFVLIKFVKYGFDKTLP